VIPLLFCRPPSKPDIDRFRSAGSPVISISLSAHLPASRGAHRYQRGAFPATRSDHSRSDEGDQRKPIFWRGASLHPRRSHCPTRPRCNASGDAVCCSQYEATYRTASGGSGTIRPCRRSDDTAPPPTGRRRARSPCASIAWVSASPEASGKVTLSFAHTSPQDADQPGKENLDGGLAGFGVLSHVEAVERTCHHGSF